MKTTRHTFAVFNKVLLNTTCHSDLRRVFSPFTLVTVLGHIATKGQYEDEHYIVTRTN